jgi:hypothetical protein
MRIKLSKTDWKSIGQKMGWVKTAQGYFNGRNSSDILHYVYNGREHTPEEVKEDIKNGVLKVTKPNVSLDDHGIPFSGVQDSEGNDIHPVFVGDLEDGDYDDDDGDDDGDDEEYTGYRADREDERERENGSSYW